ncbi:hypothetical protein [Pseudomonas sp. BN411]|uniref:hypothetical protein n=1 Tax=Pseudomonas sp. BN411 TaxID=2567887 RepID=UPI002458BF06|nr:hypothetical protein [Pseudomonas sp. BN411]MDH4562296.1 hypothetical protein [Pseudomonas sp. BN411]
MTLDIRGSLKNTKLSTNPYVVFEELLSNAIDSYLIRKASDPHAPDMQVDIEVIFVPAGLDENQEDMIISCRDNGCGLGDEQLKAFLTKDTSYKDDLSISGIGQCKGAGRIQFFHHFSELLLESTYQDGESLTERKLHYLEPQKQIEAEDFSSASGSRVKVGTSITLKRLRPFVHAKIMRGDELSSLFSASDLKKNVLVTFIQRLIGLDSRLGDFEIKFSSQHWKKDTQNTSLRRSDLPSVTTVEAVTANEYNPASGESVADPQSFKISHYKLDAKQYDLPKNSIALCAKSSPVKDITSRYLRTKTEQNNPVGEYHHIVLIESDYLDLRVNEQRDDFEYIAAEFVPGDMFSQDGISYAAIFEAIDPVIEKMVTPADWKKETVLKVVSNQFGISEEMLRDTSTRIVYGDSPLAVAERVLKKYQERVISETAQIVSLKDEITSAEPDSEDFREKINELSWKYTASLKNIDMANLSQLIVRRAAIVQILDLACGKGLAMQNVGSDARRKDERIIHSIFFPMRKDSAEVTDHDIWLLSEEYHYYDYIASDMPLSKLTWDDGNKIFSEDIDQGVQEILEKRADENSGKRPDIAIFSKEGSVIIVEFKAPGVQMDEHIGDLQEYAYLLNAKSAGKLKRFYGYLIGDSVNPLRLGGSWTKFPMGNGWFQSSGLIDPESGMKLGETYYEILHFNDVIDRAKKRIGVYQGKLNLKLDFQEEDF